MPYSASRLRRRVLLVLLAPILAGAPSKALSPEQTAAAVTPLNFVRPAAQGPGTPGFQIASDPTIQPHISPGVPAPLGMSLPIDLQGNGRPDVLACHANFPVSSNPTAKVPCRVLRPQPDGSVVDITRQLLGPGALPSMTHPREIVTGDFNRDGRLDMFIAAHGYDAPPFPGETNVLLVSNADGTYTDRSSTLPQTPDFSHSACSGDINGDGNLDIYVGNVFGGEAGPYFLIGRGDGTFARTPAGLPAQILNRVETFLSCTLANIDGDGFLDLTLGTWSANGYFDSIVLFGNGNADFTSRPRSVLPRAIQGIVVDIAPLDINRDGRVDLIMVTQAANSAAGGFGLQVLINQGNGTFADETAARVPDSTRRDTGPFYAFIRLVDFNGDGWEDLYGDSNSGGDGSYPRVWLNNGNGTWTPVAPAAMPSQSTTAILHAVDFEGDGRPDLLRLGYGGTGPDIGYLSFLNRTGRAVRPADFDGDEKSDIAVFRSSNGTWYIRNSLTGLNVGLVWGGAGDVPVAGDYDGDRWSDMAVFRPSNGTWYVRSSINGSLLPPIVWGGVGDVPVPGDYDGDQKTDAAVFRPSNGTWYVRHSSTGALFGFVWGGAGDVASAGDYDGDGLNDLAVFRPSNGTWYIRNSINATLTSVIWGGAGDIAVPGDYDADGRTDTAVFRASTGIWYIRNSSTGLNEGLLWGALGDVPVPGDYDGDAKTDMAVFRPSNGTWYLRSSITGSLSSVLWGIASDIPILRRP